MKKGPCVAKWHR